MDIQVFFLPPFACLSTGAVNTQCKSLKSRVKGYRPLTKETEEFVKHNLWQMKQSK